MAREDVEVGAADVDGLTLVLGSMASIKGTLRVEGGMPPNTNLSLLVVNLQASEAGALAGPSLTGTSAQARLKPDGTFEIPEVAPGNYIGRPDGQRHSLPRLVHEIGALRGKRRD